MRNCGRVGTDSGFQCKLGDLILWEKIVKEVILRSVLPSGLLRLEGISYSRPIVASYSVDGC